MKHALRKYLSQRGSALFMVLSLMTALMVLVMAMYFSVVSSREVQYKVFYTEQSYRSAVSLSDAIIAGLRTDKWDNTGSNTLKGAITGMDVGESISTNGNAFAAFLGTGAEEDNQLGAYTVTISRLDDEDTAQMYDMTITVSVNGVVDTTHTFFKVKSEEFDVEGPDQTFTSTGYAPNDVYVDGGNFSTDMFFDNEYTVIGGYDQMNLELNGNISSGGSLKIAYHTGTTAIKPLTWHIRNCFYIDSTQQIDLGYDSNGNGSISSDERGVVMVGGNFYMNGSIPKNCDIYILGDLHITANQSFDDTVRLFVNGKIYFEGNAAWSFLPSVYRCSGVVNSTSSNGNRTFTITPWEEDDANNILSVKEMRDKLNSATSSQTFYKWEINSTKPTDKDEDGHTYNRTDYIPELDIRDGAPGVKETLYFNDGDAAGSINSTPAHTTVIELPWQNLTATNYFDNGKDLNYSAHVIKDTVMDRGGSLQSNDIAIIIDTGDDPSNQHFIKVLPNRDFDEDGTNESFCWYPKNAETNSCELTVLIRGRGSVVIDIPDGVIYQEMEKQWVIHEGWFSVLGGTINTGTGGRLLYDTSPMRTSGADDLVASFIHTDCPNGCTSCTYTETQTTNPCNKEYDDGTKCTGKLYEIYCARHEYTHTFCPVCEHEPDYNDANNNGNKDSGEAYYGLCVNRVDRDAVDAKLTSLTGKVKDAMYAADGTVVYPTCNYFLVSCDESADIRFSGMLAPGGTETTIMQNCLFGFVYAPYMTYKGFGGNSGGGMVKFCGGMIVSDYVLSDSYTMVNCFPEYLPTDLVSSENRKNQLTSAAGREWKISLAAY